MILIFIGVVVFILSIGLVQSQQLSSFASIGKKVGILIVILGILSSGIKQIDAGRVGVKSLFGNIDSEVLQSGLHFVNPLVNITELDIKTQNYTMSVVHDEGEKAGDDAIKVLSSDGLELTMDLTVLYKVSAKDAPKILREIGADYKEKIVRPIARTKIRDIASNYEAVSIYSSKREEFQQRITKAIETDFRRNGLDLDQILIRNISLPQSVKTTIESKINAEQDAQKMQFVLQKEKQEAERKRVEAQGIADYQRILSTGLSDKQLQYEAIKAQKELALSPNAKVIIMGGRGNTPIILNEK
jgi:regulator of protease activity HflC (stomatin/prohibitin superfamily)